MDRGPRAPLLVGWRVFDHRIAPVAWVLGSDLAGCGLPAIARSIKPPALRSHTSGPGLARRWCKRTAGLTRSAAPPDRHDGSPPRLLAFRYNAAWRNDT